MLDEPSTTPPDEYTPRARRRAGAQLHVPQRIRHGARVPSSANRIRSPSRSLRLTIVALLLVAGEMVVAPEMARESALGSSRASAGAAVGEKAAMRLAASAARDESSSAAASAAGTPSQLAPSPDSTTAAHVTTSAGVVASPPATAGAGAALSDAAERAVVALLARLTEARALATRSRQTVTVVIDPATGRLWRMAGDDPDAALSSLGAIPLGGQVSLGSSAARPSFTFSLDDAEADSVWVRDGVTRVAVVLDPRSGRPHANR